ncbi:ferrous iron transporter B [Roseateles sp. BYS180W]|uniref:Ferrous iron transport protein B n=1 Tax=Roseateles rivi TaxID=3299028 RepID=A0ABW7FU86_9BURK
MKPLATGAVAPIALVGNPNCGKSALFNLLTGSRQKVANYAGVTVERKQGWARLGNGQRVQVLDLPGTYSLQPRTADEQVTVEVIEGRRSGEAVPGLIVAVVDATNLRMGLRLVLELQQRGHPLVVALNMMDEARARGLHIDVQKLAARLGCAVVPTVAVERHGHADLLARLEQQLAQPLPEPLPRGAVVLASPSVLLAQVRSILAEVAPATLALKRFQPGLDRWVMHPVWGLAILAAVLFVVFQAVFAWSEWPKELIEGAVGALGQGLAAHMAEGPLRSLLVDGVVAGCGAVLVFLPQILILFFFILVLEESGYLPRAAFLLDNLMGRVGLSGRAFIPLLSSFACAIPGIMAARTISNWRDRLATIMVAPLMTCSARLPVYALLIGAFIPERQIGPLSLRGLTLFGLYAAGVLSAMAVAWVLKRVWHKSGYQPLMLELPPYRMPQPRNILIGLKERAVIFLRRVGTIIFTLTVVLWFLSSWPVPPEGATAEQAIRLSLAGRLGEALQPLVAPIGFNWQIAISLIPGMAAREVAVSALGTVYALSAAKDSAADQLMPVLAQSWSAATAYALLAWFVFAPQCLSTLAVVRRETNAWRYVFIMLAYLFALAYAAAFVTYRVALWLGG